MTVDREILERLPKTDLHVHLDGSLRPETIWDVEERLRSRISSVPGIRTAVVKEMGGTAKSTTVAPLTVRLSGPDLDVLDDLQRVAHLGQDPGPGRRHMVVIVSRTWPFLSW